jgi:hypothetical protein
VAVQHGEHHGQPVALEADREPARARPAGVDQRLDSTSSGRVPSSVTSTHEPATGLAVGRKEDGARIGDPFRPLSGHREDADLVDRAEAVLDGAHEAKLEWVSPSK